MVIRNEASGDFDGIGGRQSLSLFLASTIVVLWFLSLYWCLNVKVGWGTAWIACCGILLRTFLQTGLFIVTHESIHGTLCNDRQVGQRIGCLTAILYACISYRLLFEKHQLHHLYPCTERDPDFKSEGSQGFWAWYLSFFSQYYTAQYTWVSITWMAAMFSLIVSLGIPSVNIFIFWLLPIILSSLQLFYFGVYLPHRTTGTPINNVHRARSSDYSELWSLVTCYHFGYHLEHHQRPDVPWYVLPKVRRKHPYAK
jgi:beta-carotene ketolase (CrtW type)